MSLQSSVMVRDALNISVFRDDIIWLSLDLRAGTLRAVY